jgi:hypothetical protein
MRKNIIVGLAILSLLFCLNAGTAASYYQKNIIAEGDNRPDFTLSGDTEKLIISIHNRVRPEVFRKSNNWSVEKYNQEVSFLENKGYIERTSEKVRITCMVINNEEGNELHKHAEPISLAIADSIIKNKDRVQEVYSTTRLAQNYSYDSMAFFLLSNVLLDNWQIENVESRFLKAQRPLRHGKNYYVAFLENISTDREAFGIYGNQSYGTYSAYGNNRGSIDNSAVKAKISSLPKINEGDRLKLKAIAEIYTPALLDILETNRNYAKDVFQKTGYADEISFEEFYIWWYHFIYSRATEILAEKGALTIPEKGNFLYQYGD